jgi:hypothetical protein
VRLTICFPTWAIECYQPPPGVGDRVSWRLQWEPTDHGAGVADLTWQQYTRGDLDTGDPDGAFLGRVLRAGPVTAWWEGQLAQDSGAAPGRGRLWADEHGLVSQAMAPVTGRVTAVDVVSQVYRRTGARDYEAVPEQFTLRAVERSPQRFDHGWMPASNDVAPGRSRDRRESELLVHLEVDASD